MALPVLIRPADDNIQVLRFKAERANHQTLRAKEAFLDVVHCGYARFRCSAQFTLLRSARIPGNFPIRAEFERQHYQYQ
jgi:hypothetical protein